MTKQIDYILNAFSGGDMRSPKGAKEVCDYLIYHPNETKVLIEILNWQDALLKMRAADCLELLSRENITQVQAFKSQILEIAKNEDQQEVCWHMAQIIPRLDLEIEEINQMIMVFENYLAHKSKIVVTFAMSALYELSAKNPALRAKLPSIIENLMKNGSGAIKARGKKILKELI